MFEWSFPCSLVSEQCIMSESWDNIAVGMKVEVINTDCQLQNEAYWIATVVQLAGKINYSADYCYACASCR